ncbi:MAG: hypothetical protein A2583_01385 [Bdellovibrionales bacterium RIFOXYD1_FULL_53_11]|nr:MAG: hypothetical protein A2583_01385 [Bdellovibrionales bacterium RIFOXYD1_FULL_53_11]
MQKQNKGELKMFKNMKLAKKVLMVMVFSLVISVVVGVIGLFSVDEVNHINHQMYKAAKLNEFFVRMQMAHLDWRLKLGSFQRDEKMTRVTAEKNPHNCAFGKWYYSDESAKVKSEMPKLAPVFSELETAHAKFHESAEEIERMLLSGNRKSAISFFGTEVPVRTHNAIGRFETLEKQVGEYVKEYEVNTAGTVRFTNILVILVIALAAALVIVFAVYITRNIGQIISGLLGEADVLTKAAVEGRLSVRADLEKINFEMQPVVEGVNKTLDAVMAPINEAAKVLDKLSARDLTVRVEGDYKGDHALIKASINTAAENLQKALSQVAESAEQVASASQQISSGSQSLAQGSNEQASSLEEISSSLEEMTSMVKQNAGNASQAKTLAEGARESAVKGNDAMLAMGDAINKIKASADQTAKIIKTIDEIAFQTNLLALNAAVEAARAGDAGKGFAVVAEEVRNLAQRSAEAAKNTASMIEESQKNAEGGVTTSTQVGEILKQIVGGAEKVMQLVGEVNAATIEQSKGIEQINSGVLEMNKVTQQNASLSEESASSAEELSGQAEELAGMIGEFKLGLEKKAVAQKRVAVAGQVLKSKSKPVEKQNQQEHKQSDQKKNPENVIPLTEEELKNF